MKSKELYILALGLLTALTPFLGLPNTWKTFLYVGFGVLVAVLAFLLRRELNGTDLTNDVFVENGIDAVDTTSTDSGMYHAEENHTQTIRD